ncbi:class I SAM-dependent methyltransferase [Brevibacillus laterosporus]|uniref:class I SAM-dependent methyltransferase n=1 Tax=Brevibacillus laterosporus TaxID=1465 RepID=UPI00264AA1C9|nr:class I SAM-dependent methyltransferase [Brevibacillus laterosporus]MDN9012721.1 class I SAM-dependent methyltransferase [Brevibacillus laterosporus]MDO0943810.1 class I SAM-dependent methyltransferase [Brevibacillus laterosporus]
MEYRIRNDQKLITVSPIAPKVEVENNKNEVIQQYADSGTGVDLPFMMHKDIEITGIDLFSDMLHKARKKYDSPRVRLIKMDAQSLTFPPESFDMVIANLILSVVPHPDRCFREIMLVTRTGG